MSNNPFSAIRTLTVGDSTATYYALEALREQGIGHIDKLPYSIKVLLEAALRNLDGFVVTADDVAGLAAWNAASPGENEVPFMPGRVVLQDFTGVPAVVDLAALRSAMQAMGGDPQLVNPLVRCDLVIDHSVQVDEFASPSALTINGQKEFERNQERYEFLKWGQKAFRNFTVVPPATGIVHQVNLEYLATCVLFDEREGKRVIYPDSLVGTDSHTTMINGLGVVGWGVGGIEAEAVMLGQPVYMLTPEVVGFRLTGALRQGTTATDLVLTVTQMLRRKGVVGKFVEFFGPGLAHMPLADRATIANMAPEYGATMGFFPIDEQTLTYLRLTGRNEQLIETVERYCKVQGLWRDDSREIEYTDTLELDLGTVEPSLAGPKRPQDRVALSAMKAQWQQDLSATYHKAATSSDSTPESFVDEGGQAAVLAEAQEQGEAAPRDPGAAGVAVEYGGESFTLKHGDVVIAAITSCTNTSNPAVMLAAGLLARNAREKGLSRKPWVKTSLAPGSKVVTEYYKKAGLMEDLEALGFHLVGYGCTTCIGNSGPLPDPISAAIKDGDVVAASVLSGNRNFEGRVNPDVKANYLASPPLVVAYAIAGTVNIDLLNEPIGRDADGEDVYLKDIWPDSRQVQQLIADCVTREDFIEQYSKVYEGSEEWRAIQTTEADIYDWPEDSTYIQHPPFFQNMPEHAPGIRPIQGARCLAKLGDSVTTDHISPAGRIEADGPAGRYLQERGVPISMFNSFGSRRGNDRVMTRGTFANVRVRNQLAPGTEGGWTKDFTDDEVKYIFDAAMNYKSHNTPLVVLAGKDYGMGSSRDWAAKGTYLLGVRAVIAESFERIHRSNLVGMGVLPLQYREGETAESLGLDGSETFDIHVSEPLEPRCEIEVIAHKADGSQLRFTTRCRIDTPVEVEYYKNEGILHTVLRRMLKESRAHAR